ncbi:hypothetical protein G6O69_28625 [Pseudenhygromyxa sp. WMMC2535]|uniref:hypothetical protein n=1 Tax=Pseudenhygromyxa sp. WMMC2535 TaxID=2712867 RepID=UPI0015554665|nr:hypothetical protein [Pseudenhygromyxa sp. WMMC2535]NVB41832.1 hypothetical protein [Pseudenhygromyxa sp. WMMC2535]
MASTTNHYDLIVLGTDVAGLVAAALAARRGKRVLLVPQGAIDGTYRLGRRNLALDSAPLIHLDCPAGRKVFEELGLWTQIRREHRLLEEPVHWVLPQNRLDEEPDGRNFAREVGREWPEDPVAEAWELRQRWTTATDELLDELLASDNALSTDGFWGRRFLNRVSNRLPSAELDDLEPLVGGHPMRARARAAEPWVQHLAPSALGKAASLRIAGLWARGPRDRAGGLGSLREQLVQRIELKSGEVKPNLRVAEILIKRGRVTGISLLGKRDRYGCEHLLVASDPRLLGDGTLLPDTLPKPLLVSLSNVVDAARRYLLHIEIDERGLSPALDGMTLCLPESPGHTSTFLAREGVGSTYLRLGPSEAGVRKLTLVRIVGPEEPLADQREQLLDELERRGVLPFARDWITMMHSPHDGREASDGRGRPVEGVGQDSAMQLRLDPLVTLRGGEPSLGVGLMPHSSGIKNLTFASRLTYPGLGLEGELIAGWAAAGAVAGAGRSGLGRNLFLGRG